MARYKDVHFDQDKFTPAHPRKQALSGTFEYILSYPKQIKGRRLL